MDREMAKAIAEWWADFLRGGKRNEAYLALQEEQSPCLGLLTRAMDSAKGSKLANPEYKGKVDTFEHELARLLVEGPDEHTHRYLLRGYPEHFVLAVDYDPQNFLSRALQLAQLPRGFASGLPHKTAMHIDNNVAVARMEGELSPQTVWLYGPVAKEESLVKQGEEPSICG